MSNRRTFVGGASLAGLAAASSPYEYKLRYGPRTGMVSGLDVPRQLDIFAECSFKAFEYKGFPRHSVAEIGNEPSTGEINYLNVFKAIHEKGFKGILGMEHGLSVDGMAGLEKCFKAYRKADSWKV